MKFIKYFAITSILSVTSTVYAGEELIDTESYVSDLNCSTEILPMNEDHAVTGALEQDVIQLPTFVVSCQFDEAFMVSLSEEN